MSEFRKFGFLTENFPLAVSSVIVAKASRFIPLPRKLFSFTPNPIVAPDVPVPAPNEISPVAFSSTLKLITLLLN